MIYIDNRQEKELVSEEFEKKIEEVILTALKEEEVKYDCEVSVIFVDNKEIKEINKDTRGIDKITDVLSYPMLNYPEGRVYKEIYKDFKFDDSFFNDGELILGDIVLSLEKAREQSLEYGHSFEREACYLVVHSVLHLLGYDHMTDEEKEIMRKREEEILSIFSITR